MRAQHDDEAFDLAPAAIMQMIANVTAFYRAFRRFYAGFGAECVHKRRGFHNIPRFDVERQIHTDSGFRLLFWVADRPGGIGPSATPYYKLRVAFPSKQLVSAN